MVSLISPVGANQPPPGLLHVPAPRPGGALAAPAFCFLALRGGTEGGRRGCGRVPGRREPLRCFCSKHMKGRKNGFTGISSHARPVAGERAAARPGGGGGERGRSRGQRSRGRSPGGRRLRPGAPVPSRPPEREPGGGARSSLDILCNSRYPPKPHYHLLMRPLYSVTCNRSISLRKSLFNADYFICSHNYISFG